MANLNGVLGGASQALLGILSSKTRVQFIQNNQAVIQIDASISEMHKREVIPSEFPVENGQVISDHLIVRPPELEITGIISDDPIGGTSGLLSEAVTSLASKLVPPAALTAISGAVGLLTAGSVSPSVAAYLKLVQIQQSGQPIDVITTLYRYSNMWIRSISVPRDAANGRVLLFTAHLVQLMLVTPQSVNVQIFANPALSANNPDLGNQSVGPSAFKVGINKADAVVTATGGKIPSGGVN